MVVIDASAVLELLLRTAKAERIEERLLSGDETLHVPHVLDLEVAQVLRHYYSRNEIQHDRAQEVFMDLEALGLNWYSHTPHLGRIWELLDAERTLALNDATYLSLAEFLSAPLLTCDDRLASASQHLVQVELV